MTAKKDSVISRFPILHKIEIVLGLFLFSSIAETVSLK